MTRKSIIAFYSHTGNIRYIAHQIAAQGNGTLLEILPEREYDHSVVEKQSQQEIKAGFRPALRSDIPNADDFDVLYIGSPNWFNTIAPPVSSFLELVNTDGKTVVPFISHFGGGYARTIDAIKQLCPNATIGEPIAVYGGDITSSNGKISEWLERGLL